MKQFILNKKPDKNNLVRLDGDDYKYLVRVRRLAVGEFFTALLPDGEETQVQIISINHKTLIGKCTFEKKLTQRRRDHRGTEKDENSDSLSVSPCPQCLRVRNFPNLVLLQALPKGEKMDLIVRQAAEGGIAEIIPFVSEFSLMKKNIISEQKFSRWERIIKEARQQSGSKIATGICRPLSMNDLFDYWNKIKQDAVGLLFHHHKGLEQKSLHSYLSNVEKKRVVVFAIGPEGGFSEKEAALFIQNGFNPITIGDTILRTETAAVYCAAAVRIILLERDSWELRKTKTCSG